MKNKSAKDIAFEKERAKFRSRIRDLEYQVNYRDKQIAELGETVRQREEELYRLNDWIQRLLQYTELSGEEMKKIIEKEKTTSEILDNFKSLQSVIGRLLQRRGRGRNRGRSRTI